jgi:hypothetical protein
MTSGVVKLLDFMVDLDDNGLENVCASARENGVEMGDWMRSIYHVLREQIALLEAKRVPVRPYMYYHQIASEQGETFPSCPKCRMIVDSTRNHYCCGHCGQPLDWQGVG